MGVVPGAVDAPRVGHLVDVVVAVAVPSGTREHSPVGALAGIERVDALIGVELAREDLGRCR